jgi:SAM-dependent methyltransferase
MFSVTTKMDYWKWIEDGIATPKNHNLKEIQDTFILSLLKHVQGKHILEVGGGTSRIAPLLAQKNEVWLIDGYEGKHGGPAKPPRLPGVKIVVGYMGQFLRDLPDDYFDYVFSVSVIEHVLAADYAACFKDIARVLKSGGETIHAVDLYLFDDANESEQAIRFQKRFAIYLNTPAATAGALRWKQPPVITRDLKASAKFAFNSMTTLLGWNRVVPELKDMRMVTMSCSAQMVLERA